ncbi:hypothetical protein D3C71_1790410 [compost metagenome]
MQGDRKIIVVYIPEFLKNPFRLRTGVNEDERRLVRLQSGIQILHGVARGMAGPWNTLLRLQNGDVWLGSAFHCYKTCGRFSLPLRSQVTA